MGATPLPPKCSCVMVCAADICALDNVVYITVNNSNKIWHDGMCLCRGHGHYGKVVPGVVNNSKKTCTVLICVVYNNNKQVRYEFKSFEKAPAHT